MPYQDLLVIIWQIAFHCFSSNRVVIIFLCTVCSTLRINTRLLSFTFVLRVIDDMTVYVFINRDKLPDSEFSWALSHSNGKLKYWSQLDNILSRYFTGVTYLSGCNDIRR